MMSSSAFERTVMRPTLVLLVANLIGMGLGPLATGALSDALRPWASEESLRYALLTLAPGYCWAGWHAWRASATVARDLAAMPIDHENAGGSTPRGDEPTIGVKPVIHEQL